MPPVTRSRTSPEARKSCGKPSSILLAALSRCIWSAVSAEVQAAQVVVQLGHGLRADERHDHARLLAHPVDGDLRRRPPDLVGDRRHLGGDRQVAVGLVPTSGSPVGSGVPPLVLARQHACAQHAPGCHRDVEGAGHRQQVPLGGPIGQAVADLQAHEARPAAQVRQRVGLRHHPGRRVGDADVQHLARGHQVIQAAHHFLDRGREVPGVHPEKIDVVGAQPLQAGFERLHHVLAAVPAGARIIPPVEKRVLGRHDKTFPVRRDELADEPLAGAFGVAVGGVDEIAARGDIGVEDAPALLFRRAPAPLRPEGHGAQC